MHVEGLPPGITPEIAARALAGRPGLVWLDGNGGPEGRYSFVGSDPAEIHGATVDGPASPFETLARAASRPPAPAATRAAEPRPQDVPWLVGYLAYEAGWPGRTASLRRDRDVQAPALWFGRYDAMLVHDRARGCCHLAGDDAAACQRLFARIMGPASGPRRAPRVGPATVPAREAHREAIRRALEHIANGDIYQVNLARRWEAPYDGDALGLWTAMRQASPVPLGAYLNAGDHAVLACTMERFLRWDSVNRRLTSRPIKGTIARRGGQDAAEALALSRDEKERAEHVMIVDLVRNDLGRVAEVGSVQVEEVLAVEPYARLSHLVSTVAARTRPDVGLADILEATFPPGSVTGAPKVRAVEIIEALEPCPRGVYTGAVGFVDRAGGLSLAVAIRTAQVRGERVHYHAGGGLVEASDPDREVLETELKARVFLEALASLRRTRGARVAVRPAP